MEIGSPVITQLSSGIIVDETATHWIVVGFDGRYEGGPLGIQKLKKGGRSPTPFDVRSELLVSAMQDAYLRAFPKSQQQKSELAHRLLLQHLGREESEMATSKKTPQPIEKKSAPKVEKKTAAPKVEKKTAAPKVEKKAELGRKGAFATTMKIKVLVSENPKRAKAAERFALYKNGMTVGEYIAAGGTLADVRWDARQQFISVA